MSSSPTYHAVPVSDIPSSATTIAPIKRGRSMLAALMLAICVVSFVLQTELAQYVQRTTNFSKPYFILYISHCCYVFMAPVQFIGEMIARYKSPSKGLVELAKDTARECKLELEQSLEDLQHQVVGSNDNSKLSRLRFSVRTVILLAVLLTIPSYSWYVSVNLTSMANLTAIYNTGCLFAYLFSILMLGDKLVLTKVIAVFLCVTGVFTMAFWPSDVSDGQDKASDGSVDDDDSNRSYAVSVLGIAVAALAAASYGFYEVYYKKYASPPRPSVLFANAVTTGIGITTILLLWIPIPIFHWMGHETFQVPDLRTFMYILGIASMSVVYNATFMCVIALVNPVFAAVGVMLTVPAVAITDVLVTGVMTPLSTIVGSIFILIGFYILNRQVKATQ
ncbi:hypothetical protein BDB00DRAFT_859317 [Zychaea mexicana]|uniref:uncharacterized protein n=1 Tax=Zychaea mexicana TaxID=64656 RepID=UPI0022FDB91D|nr:uncharacterized protein BDB00DRAFT_859317 [Zychaea mexicana]KAI9477123.1 hypothetical protein BDB00DRAFT_859317 [Zychaea mexicana]